VIELIDLHTVACTPFDDLSIGRVILVQDPIQEGLEARIVRLIESVGIELCLQQEEHEAQMVCDSHLLTQARNILHEFLMLIQDDADPTIGVSEDVGFALIPPGIEFIESGLSGAERELVRPDHVKDSPQDFVVPVSIETALGQLIAAIHSLRFQGVPVFPSKTRNRPREDVILVRVNEFTRLELDPTTVHRDEEFLAVFFGPRVRLEVRDLGIPEGPLSVLGKIGELVAHAIVFERCFVFQILVDSEKTILTIDDRQDPCICIDVDDGSEERIAL